MGASACDDCGFEVPLERNHCPHCGRPGLFPNVRAAQAAAEVTALDARYQKAVRDAASRGAGGVLSDFEAAVGKSKAVMSRPFRELDRLASSDKELFSTFYMLLDAEVRLPHGNQWDSLRRIADEALFPGYKEEIRFAALTLDGAGLPSYGECSFVLRADMIAHRTSVYEENSTSFAKRHSYELPPGYRASWADRGKLAAAKLGRELEPATSPDRFPEILLRAGATGADDHFIEAHIYRSLSSRSLERVLCKGVGQQKKAFRLALRDRLRKVDVELEEIP